MGPIRTLQAQTTTPGTSPSTPTTSSNPSAARDVDDIDERCIGRGQAVHGAAARPDAGAGRALSRCAAGADPDGGELSAGGGRGGALVEGQSQPQGRRRPGRGQGQGLGRQREVAGGLPAGPGDDEQQARLDPEGGRRDDRPAVRRGGLHPAAARPGAGGRQPQDHAAADGDARSRRAPARRPARRRDRDPADQSGHGLRAGLQPELGLRSVALSGLSAVLLSRRPTTAGVVLWRGAGRRLQLRPGLRGRRRHVRRLELGRRLGRRLGLGGWGGWGRGNSYTTINVNRATNITNNFNANYYHDGHWNHDPAHRHGVPYRDRGEPRALRPASSRCRPAPGRSAASSTTTAPASAATTATAAPRDAATTNAAAQRAARATTIAATKAGATDCTATTGAATRTTAARPQRLPRRRPRPRGQSRGQPRALLRAPCQLSSARRRWTRRRWPGGGHGGRR